MQTLESRVLPLEQSRALVEHGIVLDTILSWYPVTPAEERIDSEGKVTGSASQEGDKTEFVFMSGECDDAICPASILSELLDAIRAKVHPTFLGIDGLFWTVRWIEPSYGMPLQERSTSVQNDLLAAAALLMEVSK